ncbi:hypothetical protein [Chrysiogenes arsenatis]|uniref:hypothetical protein n=1 Tax=Chrysiogenes arsenatis TaxID=309797 RepID=UPI00135F1AC6|nr:hypothetical protein [Chrysiogenes arsenatis]
MSCSDAGLTSDPAENRRRFPWVAEAVDAMRAAGISVKVVSVGRCNTVRNERKGVGIERKSIWQYRGKG